VGLSQRHHSQQWDDADRDHAGLQRAQPHVAKSQAFVLALDDGKQRHGGPDDGQAQDHLQEGAQQHRGVRIVRTVPYRASAATEVTWVTRKRTPATTAVLLIEVIADSGGRRCTTYTLMA